MDNETLTELVIALAKLVALIGRELPTLMEHDLAHYDNAHVPEVREQGRNIQKMLGEMNQLLDKVLQQRDQNKGGSL